MNAIIETATRALTHCPAPLDGDGKALLPTGGGFEVVELSDADAALIGQTNARYSVDLAGRLVVVGVAETPQLPTIDDQIAALQVAVLDLALGGV